MPPFGHKKCNSYDLNCCTDVVSTTCVLWMGDPFEDLDIDKGDTLTDVLGIVIDKVNHFIKGEAILLPSLDLTDYAYATAELGTEEKNLLNILKTYMALIDKIRDLELDNSINLAGFIDTTKYDLACLGTLDNTCENPVGFFTLIQAIIDKVCALNTQFENIADSILDVSEEIIGNYLINNGVRSAGNNGIKKVGTGASGQIVITGLVPPNSPILYLGSTTFFDSTGVGQLNSPYEGWFLCNGNNGTPNSTSLPQNEAQDLTYIIRFT